MNKIVLGTAQFGMDYGINNKRGKVPRSEVFDILNQAIGFGIDTLDTAYAYGESEKVLGNFVRAYSGKLKIISKLPMCEYGEIELILKSSLDNLGTASLYGYLVHNFENYKKEKRIWDKLERVKKSGCIEKIGFSLYFPLELEALFREDLKIDLIQIPFSIFDQRFIPYFAELNKRRIEVYVRSVFLQGLVFKKPGELDNYFDSIKSNIEDLNVLSESSGIPIFALCLNFALRNELIHKVIVGIDNLQNFNEIMQSSGFLPRLSGIIPQLYSLRIYNENIIVPSNWNFKKIMA